MTGKYITCKTCDSIFMSGHGCTFCSECHQQEKIKRAIPLKHKIDHSSQHIWGTECYPDCPACKKEKDMTGIDRVCELCKITFTTKGYKRFCKTCNVAIEEVEEVKRRVALVVLQDSMRQINKMAMECKKNTWFTNLLTIRAIAKLSNETLKTIEEKLK